MRARVGFEQVLEIGIAQALHGAGEVLAQGCGQAAGEAAEIAVGHEGCELLARVG